MDKEVISFRIAKQLFAIEAMAIREIRAWSPPTRLPRVPQYVHGVLNLRGAVLPIIDLSARIGWESTQSDARTPIIIVEHNDQSRGLIVHEVQDMASIKEDTIQNPDGSSACATNGLIPFLQGVAPIQDEMLLLLDLAKLMEGENFLEIAA